TILRFWRGVSMDPVSVIVAALIAGAGVGAKDVASAAVKDTYQALRRLVESRLAPRSDIAALLDGQDNDGSDRERRLMDVVVDSGVDRDPEVITSAERLLALMDTKRPEESKYSVDLRDAKGVQVGDGNTQNNSFS